MPQSSSQAWTPRQQEILDAITGKIEPVRVSILYRLGLLIGAVTMIVLPVIYLVLVAAVAYGLFLHVTQSWGGLKESVTSYRAILFLYVAPIIVGVVLLLFMIKPLVARSGAGGKPRALSRQKDPFLFAFVEKLCWSVGAPNPKRIRVNSEVNASAGYTHKFLSLLTGNLTLTIGLPLAEGMPLRNFTGILAHEFGHFTQGTAMRLTYIIRTVDMWFMRVVNERDVWDLRLNQWAADVDIRIGIFFHLARFFVWLTRKLLWVLMMIGHFVSSFLLRQMEFDADRYEAQISGSDTMEQTTYRLTELGYGYQVALGSLGNALHEGRLGDNLPALARSAANNFDADTLSKLKKHQLEAQTGIFDTHPSDRARIESVQKNPTGGIFQIEGASSELFSDFPKLCKDVTFRFYLGALGPKFRKVKLINSEEIEEGQTALKEGQAAMLRFFQVELGSIRPLPLDYTGLRPPSNPKKKLQALKAARDGLVQHSAEAAKLIAGYDSAEGRLAHVELASALVKAGFEFSPEDFGLKKATPQAVQLRLDRLTEKKRAIAEKLQRFEKALFARLITDLRFLSIPLLAKRLPHAMALQKEGENLIYALLAIGEQGHEIEKLGHELLFFEVLIDSWQANSSDEELQRKVKNSARTLQKMLSGIGSGLHQARYPFEHARGDCSIGEFLGTIVGSSVDIQNIHPTATGLLQKIYALHYRTLGRLAEIGEEVEKAMDLPPLPKPVSPAEAPQVSENS